MARPTYVPISPVVLRWAMRESGVADDALAKSCGVATKVVRAWKKGESQPSKSQFRKLAEKLKRPSAIFFLDEPPDAAEAMMAFRGPPGAAGPRELTAEETRWVRRAERVQAVASWIKRQADDPGPELPLVAKGVSAAVAARLAREFLGWSTAAQIQAPTPSQVIAILRDAVQAQGIIALHVPLKESGCRGFSIHDATAPLLAINTAFNPAARVFSYGHELGHLLRRQDSICSALPDTREERWCERFSAAFFMPQERVRALVEERLGGRAEDTDDAAEVARFFNVSLRAAALRLSKLGLAPDDLYQIVDSTVDYKKPQGGGKGATLPEVRLREYGSLYANLVVGAEAQGILRRHDVLEYLNVRNAQLGQLKDLVVSSDDTSDD